MLIGFRITQNQNSALRIGKYMEFTNDQLFIIPENNSSDCSCGHKAVKIYGQRVTCMNEKCMFYRNSFSLDDWEFVVSSKKTKRIKFEVQTLFSDKWLEIPLTNLEEIVKTIHSPISAFRCLYFVPEAEKKVEGYIPSYAVDLIKGK